MIDFTQFPSPCYIMEEELLRKNLCLIKSVADRAGVEIILAFKSFAMCVHFRYSANTWSIPQQVLCMKRVWHWKNLEVKPILILLRIRNRIFRKSCVAADHITFNFNAQFRRFLIR